MAGSAAASRSPLHHDGEARRALLLLTDGLANVGDHRPVELETHAGELRRRGVATSTFGVGPTSTRRCSRPMASAGGGNFYYIETPARSPTHDQRAGRGARGGGPGRAPRGGPAAGHRSSRSLGPERVERRAPEAWSVDVGDLVARQDREIVLRLSFPNGRPGDAADITVTVHDRDGAFGARRAAARWIYADHATNDRQARSREVDRLVARLFAARARMEAVGLNKAGDFRRASTSLQGVAGRIRSYAQGDRDSWTSPRSSRGRPSGRWASPWRRPARRRCTATLPTSGGRGRRTGRRCGGPDRVAR